MKNDHIIKKQILDLTLDSQVGAFILQSEMSEIFRDELLPIIDNFFNQVSRPDETIRLDRLVVDLGEIDRRSLATELKKKLIEQFPNKLVEAVEKSMPELLFVEEDGSLPRKLGMDSEVRDFEVLTYFIRNGRLPWWVKKEDNYDLTAIMTAYVKLEPQKVLNMLKEVVKHTGQTKRLVYKFDSKLLEDLVDLLLPQQKVPALEIVEKIASLICNIPLLSGINKEKVSGEIWQTFFIEAAGSEKQSLGAEQIIQAAALRLSESFNIEYKLLKELLRKKEYLISSEKEIALNKIEKKEVVNNKKLFLDKFVELGRLLRQMNSMIKNIYSDMQEKSSSELYKITGKSIEEVDRIINLIREKITLINRSTRYNGNINLSELREQLPDFSLFVQITDTLFEQSGDFFRHELKLKEEVFSILKELQGKSEAEVLSKDIIRDEEPVFGSDSESFNDSEEIYVSNAGLVILWPYLTNFFKTLGLIENKEFINENKREKAVLLLQYLVTGIKQINEYDLMFNKVLCGLMPNDPIDTSFELTDQERMECDNLCMAVIHNWQAIKNHSVQGLRAMFLLRDGVLSIRDGHWLLRVEEKAYDILLNKMPWGISTIKLPWMQDLIFIEWRI